MGETKVEGEELKKLVKLGKKKRLSFAFCPGPKNDHTLLIDKRKPPEVIGKLAKKEGTGSKVAYGTFVVNAKTMELTCERVVPALAKVLKKYLKTQKVLVNILVMDETGAVLESDIDELPDDPAWDTEEPDVDADEEAAADSADAAPATAADTATEDRAEPPQPAAPQPDGRQQAAQLAARLKALQPALAGAPEAAAAALKKAMAMAVTQIKSADLDAADKTVTALEKAAARLRADPAAAEPAAEPAATTAPTETADPAADPAADLRRLAARAGALKGVIAGVAGPAGQKLTAALTQAARQLKAGELAAAAALLDRIELAVNRVSAPPQPETPPAAEEETAPPPEAAKWQAVQARLQPLIDQLMAEKRGDLAAINRAFSYAEEQAELGHYDKALAAAGRAVALIREAQSAETTAAVTEAEDAAPHNVVAYTQSRLNWIRTRQSLRDELATLKSAIDSASAGQPGMEDVPARSKVLFDYLDDIDTTLEDTLERLVETPDGARREGLKQEAHEIIKDYRGVLDSDFFRAVDGNGFVRTNIRAGALSALQEVSSALTA
ncbi:MAG: hypothetical protein AB7S99_02490 [Pseudodonghicola sp.]